MVFRRHNRRPRSIRCVPFTLVEVLVAMAVLAVIMLMLMKLLQGAQGAMSVTETNTRIYENARSPSMWVTRMMRSTRPMCLWPW
jgi:prepilin-type N-terminal cleavage/methylation domain-containing protein